MSYEEQKILRGLPARDRKEYSAAATASGGARRSSDSPAVSQKRIAIGKRGRQKIKMHRSLFSFSRLRTLLTEIDQASFITLRFCLK